MVAMNARRLALRALASAFVAFVVVVIAPLAVARAAAGPGQVPHKKLAEDFLAQHGLTGKSAHEIDFETILAEHAARIRVGAFELHFPLQDLEKRAGDLKDCATALLGAQEELLEWSKPAGGDQKALRADVKLVGDWIKGWKPAALAKCRECAGKDATEALGASEAVKAAAQRLAESFGKGAMLGLARESPVSLRILLAPTRKGFVELTSFLGWLREDLQAEYWVDDIAAWTTCWYDDVQAVALEYAAGDRAEGDYTKGESMNARDPTVMQQQVVQLGLQRLFEHLYGDKVPSAFVGGLAMNVVIDQFGEVNTRIDGDLRARTAAKREVFVAGGLSSGGMLPKNSAETRWREDKGKDHFVRVLALAQKEGEELEKQLETKVAGFGVRSDQGGKVAPVHAPFLGSGAADAKPPPPDFQGDFAEMIRGYKSAFIWWLQTKAGGGEKASREKFAQLLSKLGEPSADFEGSFTSVYDGAALSDATASKECLEGKFLVWLSHAK